MPNNNWNRQQFRTFLLIYAANADMDESQLENDFIRNKAGATDYDDIHKVYDELTDYERIQLILSYKEVFYETKEKRGELLEEILKLCQSDGQYDIMERNMMKMLRKLMI